MTAPEIRAPSCAECGGREVKQVGGAKIYPHRPDLFGKRFWLCPCGAYCGSHAGSGVPLGRPAGPALRKARNAAHAAFDPLWKNGTMRRREAYLWLSAATGIPEKRCHIGMMGMDETQMVIAAVERRAAEAWEAE